TRGCFGKALVAGVFAPVTGVFSRKQPAENSLVANCNALSMCNVQRTATKLLRKLFISSPFSCHSALRDLQVSPARNCVPFFEASPHPSLSLRGGSPCISAPSFPPRFGRIR